MFGRLFVYLRQAYEYLLIAKLPNSRKVDEQNPTVHLYYTRYATMIFDVDNLKASHFISPPRN